MIKIHKSIISGDLKAPPSKSHAHRLVGMHFQKHLKILNMLEQIHITQSLLLKVLLIVLMCQQM